MKFLLVSCLIFFSYFPQTCSCNMKLLPNTKFSKPFKKFVRTTINQNYNQKGGFLFMKINNVDSEIINFALQNLNEKTSVTVVDFNKDRNTESIISSSKHFTFGIADPESDMSFTSKLFYNTKISRARILLLFTGKIHSLIVEYILHAYWKLRSVNVVVAYEADGKIQSFTFNPYLASQKIEDLTKSKNELFYDKTINLHGSVINAVFIYKDRTKIKIVKKLDRIQYEGKDYEAIRTLVSHLNGKLEVVTLDHVLLNPWLESIPIVNRTEKKKSIIEEMDISLFIKSELFSVDDEVSDNLYPHAQNDLRILVPKSLEIPLGHCLERMFTPKTWITILSIISFTSIFWIIIRKLTKNKVDFIKLYFTVCRISITNTIFPIPPSFNERILIISWLFTSFLMNTFIQSKITSFLTIPQFYAEINTVEEVFASGLPVYALYNHIEEIEKKYAGTSQEMYAESIIPLGTNEGLIDQIIYDTDVSEMPSFFMEHDVAVFVSRCRNTRGNGGKDYHLVKESIIPNYQSYKVAHNCPLLPALNKILRRLEEGGFIELWAKNSIFNATIEGFLYPEDEQTRSTKPIALDATAIWFYILFIGHFLSLLVFITEIIVHKITLKKTNIDIKKLYSS